jgi:hypothetical protein
MGYNPRINSAEEARYCADLDTDGYGGKWRAAKESVDQPFQARAGSEYWLKVRDEYLACGGRYKEQEAVLPAEFWR